MPDLDELAGFDSSLGAPPLPPSEIRRRGDRLRRRRTAQVTASGVLAVAVAIGAPVVALSRSGADHDIQPAPEPSHPEPPHRWVTEVLDFPLTDGFPSPSVEGEAVRLLTCRDLPAPKAIDIRVVTYTGESEDTAQRALLVFPDEAAARDDLAKLKQAASGCAPAPVPGGGATTLVEPLVLDHHARAAEETYAVAEQVHHDDGLVSDLTLVEISRTGNALFVDSRYTTAGGDEVIGEMLQLMERASREPLTLLCVYAADPCLDPYAPLPTDATAGAGSTTPQSVSTSP